MFLNAAPRALQVLSRDIRSAHQRARAATAGAAGAGRAARVHAAGAAEALQAGALSRGLERPGGERTGMESCSGAAGGCVRGSGASPPAGSAGGLVGDSGDRETGYSGQQAHVELRVDEQLMPGAGPGCAGVFCVTLLGVEVSYTVSSAGVVLVCGAYYRPPNHEED